MATATPAVPEVESTPGAPTTLSEEFNNRAERQLAWRRIKGVQTYAGTKVDSMADVYRDLGLDFTVSTEPVYARVGDMFYPIVGKSAIVREAGPATEEQPNPQPLIYGLTGSRYKPLQNREIAALLNPLLENWSLDSVASLNDGRDLLTVFKAEDFSVNGEQMQEYFWVREGKSGTDALEFAIVPVRLWCTNQLITGMKSASFSAGIAHGQGVQGDAQFHINVFELLDTARQKLRVSFEQMGQIKLDDERVAEIIERVFPEPTVPKRLQILQDLAHAANVEGEALDAHIRDRVDESQLDAISAAQYEYENQKERVPLLRQDALNLVEKFNDEHSNLANTPWGVYNAVVELMDFGGQDRAEATAKSAMFGDRAAAKVRAFSVAMSVTDPKWEAQGNYVPGLVARTHRSRGHGVRRTGVVRTRSARTAAPQLTVEQLEERERQRQQAINQRGADKFNAAVAAGTKEPLLDADGNPMAMTAELWAQRQLQTQEDRQARLLKSLERTTQVINRRTLTLADRIRLRNDKRAELLAQRNTALAELASINGVATGDGESDGVTATEDDEEATVEAPDEDEDVEDEDDESEEDDEEEDDDEE